MDIELQCRDCRQLTIQQFTRPSGRGNRAETAYVDFRAPHRIRCLRCGGVLDPTQAGLTKLPGPK